MRALLHLSGLRHADAVCSPRSVDVVDFEGAWVFFMLGVYFSPVFAIGIFHKVEVAKYLRNFHNLKVWFAKTNSTKCALWKM